MTFKKEKSHSSLYFLSYIPFLFLLSIPHIKNKNNKDISILKLHYNQGKIITIIGLIIFILDNLNAFIFVNFLPFIVYIILGYIISVVWILWLSLIVKGMVNAVKENHKTLPLIGRIGA